MKKRIWALILVLCFILAGITLPVHEALAIKQEALEPWIASYTTYDTSYEAILKMYLKVINGYETRNYGRHDLFNIRVIWDGPSDAPAKTLIQYAKENTGFFIEDLNHDGVDEMVIIATMGRVYEIFTMDNGKVRELFRGSRYEGRCHLLNNGQIYRAFEIEGSEASYYEIWELNGTGKASFIDGYHHVGFVDEWYRSYTDIRKVDSSKCQRVSSSEAQSWVDSQENKVIRHRFVPFIAYEKFPDDPYDLGVLAKDNKTSTTAKIKIRKEPNNKSKVVMTKKVGTYVKILAKENGYYKIRIGKKEGYVAEEFLIPVTWEEYQNGDG